MTVDGGPDAAELTDNDKAQTRLSPLLMLISGFRLWVILAPLNSPTKSPFGAKVVIRRETVRYREQGSLLWKCDAKHFQVNGNIGGVEKKGG